jgi:DNA (cytosine-5)-methyltransferase 1
MLTLGSLFDGIGGWQLAAIHAGVKPVWASEIEKFPIAVTKHHFPDTIQLGDITKIRGDEIPPVDIICAGSPCQDLSVAGKQEGLKGERSGLFRNAIDIVRRMRMSTGERQPRYFVWENVPGAFSSNNGMDFRAVLSEVSQTEIPIPANNKWAEAGMVEWDGGSLAWRTLDAQYWGVPQRRKRIFLVADFASGSAGEILFERESVSGDSSESEGTGEGSSESTGTSTDSTGKCVAYSFDSLSSNSMKSANPYSGCRAVDKAGTLDTTQPNPSKNQGGIAIHSYSIAGNTIGRKLENGGNGKGVLPECSYTLNTTDRHAVFRAGGFGSFVEDKVAGTAKASGGDFGGGQRDFNKRVIGSLCARDYKGVGSQYVDEGKLVYGIQNNRKPPE